jgi:hypothetical protein
MRAQIAAAVRERRPGLADDIAALLGDGAGLGETASSA